ncbi:Tetraspanin-5 [Bulinus truncatus]|nr:Tetraspanin-5 [Bulinus truncatus]
MVIVLDQQMPMVVKGSDVKVEALLLFRIELITCRRRKKNTGLQCCEPFVKYLLFFANFIFISSCFVFYFVDGAFLKLDCILKKHFADAVKKYRDDPDMQGFIDNIQELLSCCGASNDDNGYLDWNRNQYFYCNSSILVQKHVQYLFHVEIKINFRCGADMLKPETTDREHRHYIGFKAGLVNCCLNQKCTENKNSVIKITPLLEEKNLKCTWLAPPLFF